MNDVLLLLAVALLSTSQVLQKVGAARLVDKRKPQEWVVALVSPELLGAVVAIVAGTALWLLVLYRMDVSRAFPFLSLGSVVVVAVSRFYLKERVSAYRWVGVILITAGIALVAST